MPSSPLLNNVLTFTQVAQDGKAGNQDSLKVSLWLKLLSTIITLPCSSIENRSNTRQYKSILQESEENIQTGYQATWEMRINVKQQKMVSAPTNTNIRLSRS